MEPPSEVAIPGAPPDRVRGAIQTLFDEWQTVQAERAQWKLERSQLRSRIIQLENDNRKHEKVRLDLIRRVKLLEHALLQERKHYVLNSGPSQLAQAGVKEQLDNAAMEPSGVLKRIDSNYRLALSASGHKSTKMPGRVYHTLPSNFLASQNSQIVGRQYLREFLMELGYTKEAQKLDAPKPQQSSRKEENTVAKPEIPDAGLTDEDLTSDVKMSDFMGPMKLLASNRKKGKIRIGKSTPLKQAWKQQAASTDVVDTSQTGNAKENAVPVTSTAAAVGEPRQPDSAAPAPDVTKTPTKSTEHNRTESISLEEVFAASDGKSIEVKRWKPTVQLRSHMDAVRSLSFHSTEAAVLTGGEDGTVKLWNFSGHLDDKKKKKTLEPVYTYRGHRGVVTSVELADGREQCFSAGSDGRIFVWALPSLVQDPYGTFGHCSYLKQKVLVGHTDAVWKVHSHPLTAQPLLFSAGADGHVCIWKLDLEGDDCLVHRLLNPLPNNSGVRIPATVQVLPSNMKHLLVGYTSGELSVVDIETTKVISTIPPSRVHGDEPANITDLCAHPTLAFALTAHTDKTVRVFDITQGGCVATIQTHREATSSVAIDSSGLYMATASHDQSIRFWDLASRKILHDLDGYQTHRKKYDEAIHVVRYHSSLPLVASGGADSLVKLYQ